MAQSVKRPRWVVARELVDEYFRITRRKIDWPRSNVQLENLKKIIEILRKKKFVHEELAQGGYVIDEGFDGADKYIRYIPRGKHLNHFVVNDLIKILNDIVPKLLVEAPMLKVNIYYDVDMYSSVNPNLKLNTQLRASTQIVTRATDLTELAKDFFANISRVFESFTSKGSSWVISKINFIQLSAYEFKMSTGGSYKKLPKKIINTKSCINVVNDDDKCTLWALLSALYPASDNADRVSKYRPYQNRINMAGINFPTPVKDIPKIEKQNLTLFKSGINVFSLDDRDEVFPLLISERSKHVVDGSTINLLLHAKHYVWIKDISRLLSSSASTHGHKIYPCYSCLCCYPTQEKLTDHNKYCFEVKAVTMPTAPDNFCYFSKYERTRRLPFIIYGDFEAFNIPVSRRCICSEQPCSCNFKAVSTHKQIPASYQLNTKCINDEFSKLSPIYRCERSNDLPPEVHMLKYLFNEVARIESLLDSPNDTRITGIESYIKARECSMCKKEFVGNNPKVPFYNTITSNYVGAVHQRCKVFQRCYPVVFHNLRGYDGHFILRALGHPEIAEYCTRNKIRLNCIPNNSERMMSISVGKLRFIDSYQFMGSSLEQLAKSCKDFPATRKNFPGEQFQHVTAKGVFPYEWFSGPRCFNETTLPNKAEFYSSLTDADITEQQYDHAKTIWGKFSCKTFRDYHDVYLTVDVLLLSDIFENFRTTSMKYYQLDPAHYFSAPGLSWDAALKLNKVKLELFTDPDMYLFIEKAIRGGISNIVHKHAAANNKYLSKFDENVPVNYISYLDMNNLYGAAMCLPLPIGGFTWITPQEFLSATTNWTIDSDITKITFRDISNKNTSYCIEVDVDYPVKLHDDHNDYPYLPEKLIINDDMLSPEQLSLRTTKYSAISKLVPSLLPKRGYVVHYENLKQAIDAGLILKNVIKVLRFNQSPWLRDYIQSNTTRRAAAVTDFEKDFFKLMNNSVFGKTMENIRKRTEIEIVNNKARRDKLTRHNCFISSSKITDHLSLISKRKSRLHLDKPVYVGAAVLDLSKSLMYDFHYGFAKKKWPNCKLLFTDTDSLVYQIPGRDCGDDLYEDIYQHRELFDLSDVDRSGVCGKYNDATNKKVIGKMKDEFSFKPIKEFVGLRSKMYAVLADNSTATKKAKGISNNYVKNKLKFNDYLAALTRSPGVDLEQITTRSIRSCKHNLFLDRVTKSGLCNFDDKRYCRDGINTIAFGHYSLPKTI